MKFCEQDLSDTRISSQYQIGLQAHVLAIRDLVIHFYFAVVGSPNIELRMIFHAQLFTKGIRNLRYATQRISMRSSSGNK